MVPDSKGGSTKDCKTKVRSHEAKGSLEILDKAPLRKALHKQWKIKTVIAFVVKIRNV